MRLKRHQLRRLIESIINEDIDPETNLAYVPMGSSDDPYQAKTLKDKYIKRHGSKYDWPGGKKPWWANSVIAYGQWDKKEQLIQDWEGKFLDIIRKAFDIDKEDLRKLQNPKIPDSFVGHVAEKGHKLVHVNICCDLLHITQLMQKVDSTKARKMKSIVDFIIDSFCKNASGGIDKDKRSVFFGEITSCVRKKSKSQSLDKFSKFRDHMNDDIKIPDAADSSDEEDLEDFADKQGDGFVAVSKEDDSDFKVYTMKGDKAYAYSGSPDEGWSAYKQADLKDGKVKILKVKGKTTFTSTQLDDAYKADELEENPMYAKKIKDAKGGKMVSEGLSRGSLYRRRYRRY